uniref:Candidate secreted effector n=1 Tax=Meloidogyne incognita TaxID=6306 RepID=A0A914MAU3_MELIC
MRILLSFSVLELHSNLEMARNGMGIKNWNSHNRTPESFDFLEPRKLFKLLIILVTKLFSIFRILN